MSFLPDLRKYDPRSILESGQVPFDLPPSLGRAREFYDLAQRVRRDPRVLVAEVTDRLGLSLSIDTPLGTVDLESVILSRIDWLL